MPSGQIEVRDILSWPRFPEFPTSFYRAEQAQIPLRARRYFYDWTVFTPEGLEAAEAYWRDATAVLASLLPARMLAAPERFRGINLGTFTGVFQKAWMRRGYAMYGVELQDVIADLHAYGCEGHRDDVRDLSAIAANSFDFAILDRVYCQQRFYEEFEPQRGATRYFGAIRRILKDDGAFIGVLYDWYSRSVIAELAALGGLTLWPMKTGRVAFQLDLGLPPCTVPDPLAADPDGPLFAEMKIARARRKVFVPTNEIVVEEDEGRRRAIFAPTLRQAKPRERPDLRARLNPL